LCLSPLLGYIDNCTTEFVTVKRVKGRNLMNIENLRDPNLWEYVGRRITTLGGHVGIFDLDHEADATEVAAIVCEILANTVHGPAEEWRPPTTQEATVSAGSPRGAQDLIDMLNGRW